MPNRADISTRYHVFLGTHPSLLHSSFTPVLGKPHPDVLPGYHPVPASLPVPSSGAFNVVWGLADNFQRLLNSVLGSLLNSCFCDFPVPENFSMVVPRSRFTLVWLIQVCPQKGEAPSAGEALYYVLESMLQQCLPCLKLTWASSRPSILSWRPTGTLGGFRWCPRHGWYRVQWPKSGLCRPSGRTRPGRSSRPGDPLWTAPLLCPRFLRFGLIV